MGFIRITYVLTTVFMIINYISTAQRVLNVLDFGAKGNGNTYDTSAFMNAWDESCSSVDTSVIIIPSGKTFLIQPLNFNGPCKSVGINVQVAGTILGPNGPNKIKGKDLITFEGISDLTVNGSGLIDGRGKAWWDISCRDHPKLKNCGRAAPTTIVFNHCTRLKVENITLKNSPQTHILLWNSQDVTVQFLKIHSPEDSPNTDGIHIQASSAVTINHMNIKSGDDCISIGDFCSNLTISDIYCGPGHGISIGSLGGSGSGTESKVENITVQRAQFVGTSNGARIKTYQIGKGNVQHVLFVNLTFDNVQNPLIIDQHYCFSPNGCFDTDTGVHINDVKYIGFSGTSASEVAVNLNCSKPMPCTNIVLENIHLTKAKHNEGKLTANCDNVFGTAIGDLHPKSCF